MDSVRVAQIEYGKVKNVILAPSVEWCVQNIGGIWIMDENKSASIGQEYDEASNSFGVSMDEIRKKRDAFLKETDKYTIPDWPHPTEEAKQAWLDYRQALRDLPANTEDPNNIDWPRRPDEPVVP